ncbi:hypothetical protein DY000_02041742 [Brassica cretica]|uniref:Uncharacterized protein n=1 Tax=Brassica cretica TaxID=69181 RepID=A0ABQ7BA21_BRACR|nr:hypothetical protein DY000_02041742 [Brassica cretica]
MTHSFLERIGQPEVDLANDQEESVPFNVSRRNQLVTACPVGMLLKGEVLGLRLTNNLIMELERTHNGGVGVGALQCCEPEAHGAGSSHGAGCHKIRKWLYKAGKASRLWLIVKFQFDIDTGFLCA